MPITKSWLFVVALGLLASSAETPGVPETPDVWTSMADSFDPYYAWLGIAPEDQPPNHYQLFGIESFEPSDEVIDAGAQRQS